LAQRFDVANQLVRAPRMLTSVVDSSPDFNTLQ